MNWQSWITRGAATLTVAILTVGCKSDGNNNQNMNPVKPCGTAGTKECLSDSVIRQCMSDGTWVAYKCVNATCKDNSCVANQEMPPTDQICFPGEKTCSDDGSMILTCVEDGTGYTESACASGLACVGNGLCAGDCVVGESFCVGNTVLSCPDGKGYVQTNCGTQNCAEVDGTSISTASCKDAECELPVDDCEYQCGNPKDPAADQTKFVSRCVSTPLGNRWEVSACEGATSCDPAGGPGCGFFGIFSQAACSTACVDGQTRCNGNFDGIETCTGGVWVETLCGAGFQGNPQTCIDNFADPTKHTCGDFICLTGVGTCTADGKFRSCDANGSVTVAPRDCEVVCIADTAPSSPGSGAELPGRCGTLCTENEVRCVAGNQGVFEAKQTCIGGVWAAPTVCPDSGQCIVSTVAGKQVADCFPECVPGTVDCCNGDDKNCTPGQIRNCGNDGKWQAGMDCAMGTCTGGACKLECFPGKDDCDPDSLQDITFPQYFDNTRHCSDKGLWVSSTPCDAGKSCRYTAGGQYLGCVECAYNNDAGLVDTRCNDSGELQSCTPSNTWGASLACTGDAVCVDPYNGFNYCLLSDTDLKADGTSCLAEGEGAPIHCGTVSDCCALDCFDRSESAQCQL